MLNTWYARLVNPETGGYLEVHAQAQTRDDAERLAQRQNLRFAEQYKRDPYELVELRMVKPASRLRRMLGGKGLA